MGPTYFAIAFGCFFGAGLLGMRLRKILPEEHLADDSRHLLETSLGIIGTVGGLVLGLLVGTAFGSYNAERSSLVQLSANIVLFDRLLAHYGPEAAPVRADLREAVSRMIREIWPPPGDAANIAPGEGANEALYDKLENLAPKTEEQTAVKGQATGIALSIAQVRWQMFEQAQAGISWFLIALLVFWFTITFAGLGVFARPNPTVVVMLFLASFSLAGAIFVLEEMSAPFHGIIRISSAPLTVALAHLGK